MKAIDLETQRNIERCDKAFLIYFLSFQFVLPIYNTDLQTFVWNDK